ncbi:MAG: hypothetical protein GXP59_01920, partial [Deltaproteobacteria bacterium]|nr:hypothetical protein [Deltaproteobacteria bacterium]
EPRPLAAGRRRIKKVIILSRVTAGADIAITSVMVHRLAKSLPWAELILIGPGHLAAMFPELDLRSLPFVYKNDGQLVDKVTSWLSLYEMVRREIQGDAAGSILLFDPDTRMTQLGLLPLAADSSTCYFPSRVWQSRAGSHANLSVLTNNWLNIILGETEEETPYLILHSEGHGYNAFCQQLRARGVFVIAVNLGVGNDCRKRISGSFEERLLFKLAREPHTMLILDSGRGEEEMREMRYLFERARQHGIQTASLGEEQIPLARIKFNHGLVSFRGSLEALGCLIGAADCFIGYDSCGQHLAAATGAPAVIIFAGAPSRRFIEHWSPAADKMKIITTDSRQANTEEGCAQLIAKVKKFINLVKTS